MDKVYILIKEVDNHGSFETEVKPFKTFETAHNTMVVAGEMLIEEQGNKDDLKVQKTDKSFKIKDVYSDYEVTYTIEEHTIGD